MAGIAGSFLTYLVRFNFFRESVNNCRRYLVAESALFFLLIWGVWGWFVAGDAFSVIPGRIRRSDSTDILLSMDPASFDDEV